MKRYDVFKSQGGYGVAQGIYLDCPVVGTIAWFEAEENAQRYADELKKYDTIYAEWEARKESDGIYQDYWAKCPRREDYITIKPNAIC